MEALRNDEDSKDVLDKNEEKNQRFRARQAEDTEREEKRSKLEASRQANSSSYTPEDGPTIPSSSSKPSNSSTNPSSSSKRGPDPEENTNRIVRPKSQEQRGGKRSETNVDEREVRARMPESRGKRGFRILMGVLILIKLTWRWRGKQLRMDLKYCANQKSDSRP